MNAPCPFPVITFGRVQQPTHQKVMTGDGQLTRCAFIINDFLRNPHFRPIRYIAQCTVQRKRRSYFCTLTYFSNSSLLFASLPVQTKIFKPKYCSKMPPMHYFLHFCTREHSHQSGQGCGRSRQSPNTMNLYRLGGQWCCFSASISMKSCSLLLQLQQ